MKFDFTLQTILKSIFVLFGIWVLLNANEVLFPLIVSIVLTFILNPLVDYFGRRRISRTLAVLLAFGVASIVLIFLISFILLPFAQEFERFSESLPKYVTQAQNLIFQLQQSTGEIELPPAVKVVVDGGIANATSYSTELGRRFLAGILDIASHIVNLVVVPILTFYFLKDWVVIRETFIDIVPVAQRSQIRQIIVEIGTVISGYIRGQIMVSVIVGILVFVGMYSFKISNALTIGLIAALTEFIPIIGPIIGAIPALLFALLTSPLLALKVTLFYIIVQQVENHIIVPKIMGHNIDLHPVSVILAFLFGAQLFGLAGMILAVPITAILKIIFHHVWYSR